MNWQEKRNRQRQGARLWVGAGILFFFFFIVALGFLQKMPWGIALQFLSHIPTEDEPQAKDYPLAPIPQNDPTSQLVSLLREENIAIQDTPVASESALIGKLTDETLVIFSTEKDMKKQVSSLQIILSRLTIEGKKAVKIDFRYEVPIIVYER